MTNLLLAAILFFSGLGNTNIKVQYQLIFCPDSTDLNRKMEEDFFLDIKAMKQSFFYSENFGKTDSIKALINSGKLSPQEYMADPKYRFKTMFNQFTTKNYADRSAETVEKILFNQFLFPVEAKLKWTITEETDTISGFVCTKATTSYAGRDYVAWFTMVVPVADGPYVFWGLPGLVVQVGDTKEHYVFTLSALSNSDLKIKDSYALNRTGELLKTNRNKAFELREDARINGLGAMERSTGRSMDKLTLNGESMNREQQKRKRAWNNNPLELQ
tara:strand:- start:718 stop:1536 length:819 start_codon:yes stop_codon:yes gene_type:complete